MARRRERNSPEAARPSSASRSENRRRRIRFATFGTAIGIATSFVTIALGAFDLRDKVASVDARDATFSSSSYVQGVAAVCDERDDAQGPRRTDALELKRRMKAALGFPQQRVLVLEFVNRELNRGDHALAMFAGLAPPSDFTAEHQALRRRWGRNVERLRVHRDRIERSATRPGLVRVLDRLDRSLVETETRRVESGLRRLAGSACHIGPPEPIPVVTLPAPSLRGQLVPPDVGSPQPSSQSPDLVSPGGSPAQSPDGDTPVASQESRVPDDARVDVVAPRSDIVAPRSRRGPPSVGRPARP